MIPIQLSVTAASMGAKATRRTLRQRSNNTPKSVWEKEAESKKAETRMAASVSVKPTARCNTGTSTGINPA